MVIREEQLSFTREVEVIFTHPHYHTTAPDEEAINGDAYGWGFTADADACAMFFRVPDDWDGTDLKLRLYWCPEDGVQIGKSETVIFYFDYRSIVWETETTDNGTAVSATTTYQDPGSGDQESNDTHVMDITIDEDHGDQPITIGDIIIGRVWCDKTNQTYSGEPMVALWAWVYNKTSITSGVY